jgi:hypothetical protein
MARIQSTASGRARSPAVERAVNMRPPLTWTRQRHRRDPERESGGARRKRSGFGAAVVYSTSDDASSSILKIAMRKMKYISVMVRRQFCAFALLRARVRFAFARDDRVVGCPTAPLNRTDA